ncbi:MarR family winged helix-turn-helix transcriptional regulator [Paraburkholderia sp. DHOC27]|uniref:MarR family winged helix-turn-helix transcriptional regulator n=1 Tax=Paraburkholderia sp. DHOC27 TaxID=2303330 RepID=UPI000E3E3385|nr:MarR family winged helix-turn-helix transcriptional regulator [Paraburkholderia sp. DHOC27]RFU44671.1 MarR family transcriptional regulator [Paraburkholderia sp. DHOC27]
MHTRILQNDDCFAVRQAARQVSQLYERHLSAAGVTPTQFSILTALGLQRGQTMQCLSTTMVMERTTVIRALKPLLKCGYVSSAAEDHGRRLLLSLTEKGRAKQEEAAQYWQAAQMEFEERFGAPAAVRLREELFRIGTELSPHE